MILMTVTAVDQAEGGKGKYLITIKVSSGQHEEVRTFFVFRYFLQDTPFAGNIPAVGDFIGAEQFDALEMAEEASKASVKAVSFLAYSDQTARKLTEKLRNKGFSQLAAEQAVAFMQKKHYIREEDQLIHLMQLLCEKKRYGVRRIRQEVYQKGFSAEAVDAVWEDTLETLDFDAALDERLVRLGTDVWDDPQKRQKTFASLMRYGFTPDEITRAIKRLSHMRNE